MAVSSNVPVGTATSISTAVAPETAAPAGVPVGVRTAMVVRAVAGTPVRAVARTVMVVPARTAVRMGEPAVIPVRVRTARVVIQGRTRVRHRGRTPRTLRTRRIHRRVRTQEPEEARALPVTPRRGDPPRRREVAPPMDRSPRVRVAAVVRRRLHASTRRTRPGPVVRPAPGALPPVTTSGPPVRRRPIPRRRIRRLTDPAALSRVPRRIQRPVMVPVRRGRIPIPLRRATETPTVRAETHRLVRRINHPLRTILPARPPRGRIVHTRTTPDGRHRVRHRVRPQELRRGPHRDRRRLIRIRLSPDRTRALMRTRRRRVVFRHRPRRTQRRHARTPVVSRHLHNAGPRVVRHPPRHTPSNRWGRVRRRRRTPVGRLPADRAARPRAAVPTVHRAGPAHRGHRERDRTRRHPRHRRHRRHSLAPADPRNRRRLRKATPRTRPHRSAPARRRARRMDPVGSMGPDRMHSPTCHPRCRVASPRRRTRAIRPTRGRASAHRHPVRHRTARAHRDRVRDHKGPARTVLVPMPLVVLRSSVRPRNHPHGNRPTVDRRIRATAGAATIRPAIRAPIATHRTGRRTIGRTATTGIPNGPTATRTPSGPTTDLRTGPTTGRTTTTTAGPTID